MHTYSAISDSINYTCVHRDRLPLRRNPALQALIGAALLQGEVFGIDTAVKAALAVGISRSMIHAVDILLPSQDADLIARVLGGCESLISAANKVRRRAKLIDAFKHASDADRIALGSIIGPSVVFDRVVVPAL